jgi:hypothetical protein
LGIKDLQNVVDLFKGVENKVGHLSFCDNNFSDVGFWDVTF